MNNNKTQVNKDYLTVKELSELIGISRVAVFNRIKLGKIKAEKIGRNYIIQKKDLDGLLKSGLSDIGKKEIEAGVKKVLHEYGETIKMLSKE